MLIDLDLAIVNGERTGGRNMTGAMEFMAVDVLRGVEHTYSHNLESFFYVLLWMCARRAWSSEFHAVQETGQGGIFWGSGMGAMLPTKRGHINSDGFDYILMDFAPAFDCTKPLCRAPRKFLFPSTEAGRLDLGTAANPKTLYEPIIKAFEDAIAGLDTDT